jgi:hypothetical protein
VRRWTRFVVFSVATLAMTSGQSSANAACPLLDLACQADEVITVADDLVEETTDAIDTPVDDTIDPIVDDVLDRVDDVVGGGPVDLPDIPDPVGDGGGSHSGGPPVGDDRVTPGSSDRGGRDAVRGAVGGRDPDGPGVSSIPAPVISAASGVAPSGSDDRTAGNRVGGTLGSVARGFAILLALFGLAVAFVAIQDRLDRRDPKLALAPVESDVVEFA